MGWTRWGSATLRGWALLIGAVILGILTGGAAAVWVPGPAAAAVGAGLAAGVFGVISAHGKALLDKQAARRKMLPQHVVTASASGRPQRVRELDEPILLRVHPAAMLHGNRGGRPVADQVPPYVPRDCQHQLWDAVAGGGFVLLAGDSTAGKTRAAYEAVRAVLPDHVLVAPSGRYSLDTVVLTVLEQRRCVLWLDDIERFLGASGLTAAMVARLLGSGDREVVLLATMRTAEYDRYSVREQGSLTVERETWRAGREVLELAHVIELPREWSSAELERARGYTDDPRIRSALGQCPRLGLAEALAAGPDLAQDWRNAWRAGAHPRGAALVAAAVDCRRAGVHEPVPISLLAELAEVYLARRQGPLLRAEPLDQALAWASAVCHGTSSLLLPTSQPDSYVAFDYLVDLPGHDAVPRAAWNRLIEHATPAQAFDIGNAANRHVQFPVAAAAFLKAAAGDVTDADIMLAGATASVGDSVAAKRMLSDAIARRVSTVDPSDPGVLRARQHLARIALFNTTDDANKATKMLEPLVNDQRRVLGHDHSDTLRSRYYHALSVGLAGDVRRAVALLVGLQLDQQRVLGAVHRETLETRNSVIWFLWQSGDVRHALDLAVHLVPDEEESLGVDHRLALQTRGMMALLTGEIGEPARAVELLRQVLHDRARVLGADHHHVLGLRVRLAYWLAQAADRETATAAFAQVLIDWQRVLGPDNPGKLMAYDCHLACLGLPPRDTPLARKELEEFLWTCQHLLGQQHSLTVDTQQLLYRLTSRTP
jgi:tetratricopeptide repeat protein